MVRRYIEIYSIMLRNSLIRELSFKANFLLWMLVEVLWFCGQIVFFSIIFGNVDRIGDWTKWEVVLLVGTHQIIAQLFQAFFFMNVANIPELVRTGKLDSLLVLPIDSQFAASTKQFGLDSVVNAIVGAAVVCVSLAHLNHMPSAGAVVLYLVALGFGVTVHYSIMLGLAAVSRRAEAWSAWDPWKPGVAGRGGGTRRSPDPAQAPSGASRAPRRYRRRCASRC